MRRLSVLLLAIPFALAGCPWPAEPDPDADPDPDGVACAQSAGAAKVRIDIGSYQQGPKGDCEVDPGTVVTWRAPVGESRPFMLEFSGSGPGGPGTPPTYSSRDRGDRHTLELEASGPSGTYPYVVRVDGVEIDPAIIIR